MDITDISKEMIRDWLPKRSAYAHKGSCGRVLIIAGNAGMTGAAVFAATAALRSGSGLVYVCTPKSNYTVIQTLVPEAICVDWDQVARRLTGKASGEWTYDAIAFGPGMGTSSSSRRMLKTLLLSYDGPVVIDADGLNLLSEEKELKEFTNLYNNDIILTPHVGEARRLLADQPEEIMASREDMVRGLVEEYDSIAILKGAGTLVARRVSEEWEISRNTTGNPGMATAGSGDVLTGVIVSLLGQGMEAWEATNTGVYIHGRAGDLACEDKGEAGLIARDIVEQLPYAIKSMK